ncbi:MAG: 2-oxo acid dehydrogenase subunit E2 [Haloarculaceae archaeon]
MGYEVRMPQLGMSMEEGTVTEWRVAPGDDVSEGDVVAVVESEKTIADVEAREAGLLRRVLVDEGETVEPGDPIGIIAGPDEDLDQYATSGGSRGSGDAEDGPASTTGAESGGGDPDTGAGAEDVRATPGARRRAEEAGVSLADVEGTGPQGVVTEADVEAAAGGGDGDGGDDGTGSTGVATRTVAQAQQLSGMQQTISERLSESERNAVRVTLNRSFDAGAVTRTVGAAREAGLDVTVTDLLLAAVSEALEVHPALNAVFEEGEHRLIEEVNLGVAVDVDGGLVTPVLSDVAGESVETVAERRRTLVDRTRAGNFTTDDLEGGTFTITNLGPFGVDHFDPVIDPPQVAILGVGRTREDGSMTVSLSFDHRVVNGADAARFLGTLVETAGNPDALSGLFEADLGAGGRESETREVSVENPSALSGSYTVAETEVAFDEPTDAGGTGTAPTPVEHLLGALGACLSLSVRAMADRDEVDVDAVAADVEGSPVHGALEAVTVTLTVESGADGDDLDRVVTKAERGCYVERALADDLDVSVTWTRE